MNKKIMSIAVMVLFLTTVSSFAYVPAGIELFSDRNVVSLFNSGQNVSIDKPINKMNFKQNDKYCADNNRGFSVLKTGQENGVMFVPLSPVYLSLIEEQKRTPHYCMDIESIMLGRDLVLYKQIKRNMPDISLELRIAGNELMYNMEMENYSYAHKLRQNPGLYTNNITTDKPSFWIRTKYTR
jgi:hypothetical protein